ncbi:MAG TPA: ABC transporter ATP-binding protein [Terriglobia bacterium]|nr:ABC transporter ATP-binding protein [Terriglobia bacterium]
MLAIETKDLTKDYGVGFWKKRPRRVLDGLSIQVEKSEVFGLLGPNGAGKSTTLKILLRLIFPTSGSARILGKELDDTSAHARIGFLPENPSFYDNLTAEEFLNYAGELFSLPAAERRRRAARLLAQVGLEGARDVQVRKFSKGMVQRLGIAQALINDPELVFLDEPMSGLDPLGRREVRDLILDLKQEGKTVFFSTHILSDAEMLCDRVAILHLGRMQGCGELKEMLEMDVAKTEIMIQSPPPELLEGFKAHGGAWVRTGERVRVEIPSGSDVSAVLGMILQSGAEVVSVNAVKISLEDYFMEQVGKDARIAPEKAAVGPAKGER